MAFNKITDYESNIKVLPDRPSTAGITPDQLKRLFDGRTDKEVKILFNQLIDDLLSDVAAGHLGALQIDGEDDSESNLQAKLLFLKTHTDTLVSKMIDDIRDNISEAQRKAEEAAQKAEVAQDRAETAAENAATEAAEEAVFNVKELLEEHVADSEAAKLGAETAQSEAENSQIMAMNSQIMAERAQYKAEEAQAKAEAAAEQADTYSSQAQNSATNAFSYSTQANTSREMAEAAEREAQAAQGMAEIAKGEAEAQAEAAREQALIAEEKARVAAQDVVALLLQYIQQSENAREAAEDAAEEAQTSASEAQGYADSINPDEMKRLISERGDNLEYDEAENLLYLTANGIRISDGIKVISSGGGGGGGSESNNAVLTLTNTTGFLYKTIAYGNDIYITGEWSSIEDDMQTGPGVLKVTANGSVKISREIEQGDFSINVGQILTAGENNVKFSISDTYGNSRSINFNITAVYLRLTSSFDANKVYTGSFAFPYTPTAAVTKTMHFIIDGNEIGTAVVLASGREQTFTIPAQSHGMHTLEAYYEANIDGEDVESDRLYYNIGCAVEGDNTPIIIMDMREETAEQFDTVVIPWRVYDPASLTANVTLTSAAGSQNLTVDRTEQSWSYRPEYVGEDILTISCVGSGLNTDGVNPLAVVQKVLNVTASSIDVEAETSGLSLYLASYGRSNNEENPSEWTYGAVEAELENFNFTSDGWQNDEKGVTVLRVSGDARVHIPVEIFREDFRTTGKTIEIEFASRNVLDYDAVIASCMSGSRGLEITAQQSGLYSEQSEIGTRYKEDEHIRLTFVVEKRSANRLLLCYLNGVLSGASVYPADDDFSQTNPLGISLGSNECTIDIYNIRIYDNDLTRFQILDNWIADTAIAADKAERFRRNDIFDEYGSIVIEKLPDDLPYMVLNTPVLPAFKGDKKTCSGYYIDPVNMKNNFSFTDATIDVQGTSSQYYRVKNFKIKFGNGFILWDDTVAERYSLDANVVPTNEYTMKADVASQEGANNVVLADMFNELCPVKTPAQEDDSRVRQTIFGKPIVIFHDSGNGPKFVGKYNFNNDKGTAEVFGFEEGDESWEILQNGTDRVGWRSSDFIGDGWKNDFEARYPEDNTNTTRLATFASWISITNPDNATNQMLTSPVVYNNFTYTQDTAAYRLARFHDELPLYASVRQSIFYYLFTLTFLCIDQREKNAFPTYINRMGKWLWLFYDADSSLGKDNKGNHTFDFYLEDIDFTEGGDPVFNGQNSVFWKNLRSTYWEKIKAEYQRLRTEIGADGYPLLSYEGTIGRYQRHQGKWPEAIYNEDGWIKSIEAWTEDGETMYLPMLVGKAELWIMWWLYNRFRYLDSLFETGTSLTNRITIRAHAKADVKLMSYVTMYGRIYFNADMVGQRMFKDTEYTFHWDASGAEDPVIGINDADRLTSLGDLSPLFVELIDVSKCEHLTYIKLGDGAESYRNTYLNSITFGNNPLLVTADIRNCVNLTMAPDFSGCTNIEEIYLDGTSVTGAILPNGGILKKLHLPDTIKNLTVLNQKMLSEFVLGSYSQIETLRLENVPDVIPSADILAAMPENSRVRIVGFDWNAESAEAVLVLYDRLDTMRGQDENGNNVDKPQMSGIIRVDNITGAQLAEMQSRYPDIKVIYQHITSSVYFWNHDGTELLYTATSVDGAAVTYSGSTPTKPATAQYNYTHSGWSKTLGGAADANALKDITGDRNVYPAFISTVRTYTVTWVNGSTTLETDTNVPYDTIPTYDGDTPVSADGLESIGWSPEISAVVGDITYTAVYLDPWDDVFDAVEDGTYKSKYAVGDTIPLNLGSEGKINMQIAAFDADDLADGTGKAAISWVAKELLKTKRRMNVAYTEGVEGTGSYYGWEQSEMRRYLDETIKGLMPQNVRNQILSVVKTQYAVGMTGSDYTKTTHDEVWLLTSSEARSTGIYGGIFTDAGSSACTSRQKCIVGTSTPVKWWTRHSINSLTYHAMYADGNYDNDACENQYGVCIGFCTGKAK